MDSTRKILTAEYIWLDSTQNLRGKTRTFVWVDDVAAPAGANGPTPLETQRNSKNVIKNEEKNEATNKAEAEEEEIILDIIKGPMRAKKFPAWNFDGSSTGQATPDNSEVYLEPVKVYRNPLRPGPSVLVLCECVDPQGDLAACNTRRGAQRLFQLNPAAEPWYAFEQEYVLFRGTAPLGWVGEGNSHLPQGQYYCGVGAGKAFGREVAERHLAVCLQAGLRISGVNAEVFAGQWEFQLGPCAGIDAGDQLWAARYFLHRVCEREGLRASFEPKPVAGAWNGSGGHVNFSTKAMRGEGGLQRGILPAIKKLAGRHREHMAVYGEGNEERLSGSFETSRFGEFSWGFSDRKASVRVSRETQVRGRGYLEDRRPAANLDPYAVAGILFETCCLN